MLSFIGHCETTHILGGSSKTVEVQLGRSNLPTVQFRNFPFNPCKEECVYEKHLSEFFGQNHGSSMREVMALHRKSESSSIRNAISL